MPRYEIGKCHWKSAQSYVRDRSSKSREFAIAPVSASLARLLKTKQGDSQENRHYWNGGGCAACFISVVLRGTARDVVLDRKSTRLNSSHVATSYAVYCL